MGGGGGGGENRVYKSKQALVASRYTKYLSLTSLLANSFNDNFYAYYYLGGMNNLSCLSSFFSYHSFYTTVVWTHVDTFVITVWGAWWESNLWLRNGARGIA